MGTIFLSASVPIVGRGNYHETADPFLIQFAVRELIIATIRDWKIVWGGHPAITPMIATICQDLNIDYAQAVTLYQSQFFAAEFPPENSAFNNIVLVDAVAGDRQQSLRKMRTAMLSRPDLDAAVFIGGMEGVEIEYEMFTHFHPQAKVLPVAATGGAARELALRLSGDREIDLDDIDFARMFRDEFSSTLVG
jgi:SLOG cluster3 family